MCVFKDSCTGAATPCHRDAPRQALTPAVGRLHGFDLLDQPLVTGLAPSPAAVLTACSTLPLRRGMVGRDVVVLFEGGNPSLPIILGVIETSALDEPPSSAEFGARVAMTDGAAEPLALNLREHS